MGALLERFHVAGITFDSVAGGGLRATGALNDEARAAIREHKAAILAELAAANEPASTEHVRELRKLIDLVLAGASHADRIEALDIALGDATSALLCFRALVGDLASPADVAVPDSDDRRRCIDCTNLTPDDHRCLAARRGERPCGAGRNYHPEVDGLKRCERYKPKPNESDQRSGAERWPYLVAVPPSDDQRPIVPERNCG